MKDFYIFKINDSFFNIYENKTYYLYKILENISKTSNNDFISSYKLYEQIILPFDKSNINSTIYKSYKKNKNYNKNLNKHILNNDKENTKLTIYNTYIKIKTNKSVPEFIKTIDKEDNLFICDFKNKDYFWLNKVKIKKLV